MPKLKLFFNLPILLPPVSTGDRLLAGNYKSHLRSYNLEVVVRSCPEIVSRTDVVKQFNSINLDQVAGESLGVFNDFTNLQDNEADAKTYRQNLDEEKKVFKSCK